MMTNNEREPHEPSALNHRLTVVSGVLADECRALMERFFAGHRSEERRAT